MTGERSSVPRPVASIEALVDRYALFLFDQFGVLHDGVDALPGMHATLRAIKMAGRRVGVITNSGKRAAYNRERLADFGFDATLIDVVASSGEVAWRALGGSGEGSWGAAGSERVGDGIAGSGGVGDGASNRVLIVRRGAEDGFLDGLPLIATDDPHACDLVIISGCEPEHFSLDDYRARLAPAAARGVPALCTNPDRTMLLGGDRRGFAPGVVAELYETLGGTVRRIGKPWPAIYAHALATCGVAASETLCIGDSVEHDIVGARAAGCDALLVRTGIHARSSDAERHALYEAEGARPDWIIAGGDSCIIV